MTDPIKLTDEVLDMIGSLLDLHGEDGNGTKDAIRALRDAAQAVWWDATKSDNCGDFTCLVERRLVSALGNVLPNSEVKP